MTLTIKSSSLIKHITRDGRTIALKYATQTDAWNRSYLSSDVAEKFVKAVENKAYIPPDVTEIIMAETDHKSPADERTHFTAQANDDKGERVEVMHILPASE
ncbi:hypothetical protein MYCTH_2297126 [Thermothelomyces thermophilus ATCC 42464]|uniref:Uncharacterized protein n=1 Tax=Thermothelomyces thermophilus (strain ATCC 42464 / BCRC 31852 / DSM 1799) TaxID=573729 RepID=G2Q4A0_THET4|nr:uncharacterized protein MYCTH_2297126 [Thermothelomyces thermophilus ATCC 42464]AEO54495.1 hypothetical protein MYCTH_2297126 [Thermothelomyces thermophilus ATCC 42464]